MLYALAVVFLVAVDQAVKFLVRANSPLGESIPFLPHVMNLTFVQNTGAAFSLFREHTWLLTLVSAAASAVLAVVLWKRLFITHPLGRWPLAVILAGAVGNLIDRAALGYVTDMFQTTFIRFAVFNVADICVVCGGIALVAYVLFGWERLEKRGDGHEQADADRPV